MILVAVESLDGCYSEGLLLNPIFLSIFSIANVLLTSHMHHDFFWTIEVGSSRNLISSGKGGPTRRNDLAMFRLPGSVLVICTVPTVISTSRDVNA